MLCWLSQNLGTRTFYSTGFSVLLGGSLEAQIICSLTPAEACLADGPAMLMSRRPAIGDRPGRPCLAGCACGSVAGDSDSDHSPLPAPRSRASVMARRLTSQLGRWPPGRWLLRGAGVSSVMSSTTAPPSTARYAATLAVRHPCLLRLGSTRDYAAARLRPQSAICCVDGGAGTGATAARR
jgi:hypothetical protein